MESNPIHLIEREHEIIERELIELETITEEESVNYPNLIHVIKTLFDFLERHSNKEKNIFEILSKKGYNVPFEGVSFSYLKREMQNLREALQSQSEFKVKEWLNSSGKEIIKNLRDSLEQEEWFFCSVNWEELDKNTLGEIQIEQVLKGKEESFISELLNFSGTQGQIHQDIQQNPFDSLISESPQLSSKTPGPHHIE